MPIAYYFGGAESCSVTNAGSGRAIAQPKITKSFLYRSIPMPERLYKSDFYAWTQHQAELLRAHQLSALDTAHLAEELENVGHRGKRELASYLEVLLVYMLKWQFQPNLQSRSW